MADLGSEGDGAPPGTVEGSDGVGKNAAFALASQLVTSVFTAALILYLVRALGPGGYGVFSLAVALGAVLLLPADFGISQSTGRFVAERFESPSAIGAVLAMAVRVKLAVAIGVGAALALAAGPISDLYDSPDLAWPLRGAALAMAGQSVMQLAQGVFIATRRMSRTFTLVASESATEFSASVALVVLGAGATGAAFGRATGYLLGAALGLILIARLTEVSIWRPARSSPVAPREFIAYAGALLIIDGAFALFNQVDVLIIGGLLGTTAAGIYSAPLKLLAFLGYPGLSAAQAVAPRLASYEVPVAGEVKRLEAALRLMVLIQLPVAIIALVWAEPIINLLLGEGFEDSVAVFRAVTPFIFLLGLGPLATLTLNYTGHARRRVPIALAALALNAGFDFVMVPSIGVVAGSYGTDLSYALFVGWHLYVCRSELGIALRPLGLTLARASLSMLPMAGLMLLLVGDGLAVWEWFVGLLVGPLLSVGALLLTREVTSGELATVGRASLRILRSRRTPPAR